MTKEEWLTSRDPKQLARFLRKMGPSDRQSHLTLAICLRFLRSHFPEAEAVRAAELWERYLDGLATEAEVKSFYRAGMLPANMDVPLPSSWGAAQSAIYECVFWWTGERGFDPICAVLRDIFNPFHKAAPQPPWLTDSVVALAKAAYDDRKLPEGTLDRGRLAVLADLLEENGCNAPEVLGHLRDKDAVHVRGCWVVDLLLRKT